MTDSRIEVENIIAGAMDAPVDMLREYDDFKASVNEILALIKQAQAETREDERSNRRPLTRQERLNEQYRQLK